MTEMMYPARCAYCQTVYDLAAVEVIARYTDCSVWKCSGCSRTVDDRGETGWKSQQDYYRVERQDLKRDPHGYVLWR